MVSSYKIPFVYMFRTKQNTAKYLTRFQVTRH